MPARRDKDLLEDVAEVGAVGFGGGEGVVEKRTGGGGAGERAEASDLAIEPPGGLGARGEVLAVDLEETEDFGGGLVSLGLLAELALEGVELQLDGWGLGADVADLDVGGADLGVEGGAISGEAALPFAQGDGALVDGGPLRDAAGGVRAVIDAGELACLFEDCVGVGGPAGAEVSDPGSGLEGGCLPGTPLLLAVLSGDGGAAKPGRGGAVVAVGEPFTE